MSGECCRLAAYDHHLKNAEKSAGHYLLGHALHLRTLSKKHLSDQLTELSRSIPKAANLVSKMRHMRFQVVLTTQPIINMLQNLQSACSNTRFRRVT